MSGKAILRLRLLFIGAVAIWFLGFVVWPGLFRFVGLRHYGVWFLDSFAILASNDAQARGLDPYLPNPLDYFDRPHVYTRWWLSVGNLGLTRAHNLWVGVVICVGFVAAALAFLRPRGPRELWWYLVVLGAPPMLLGFDRANNDLLIFALLAPVVPCLLHARPAVRFLPVGLIALAAGLKFFPASAGLVLLAGAIGERRERRLRVLLGVVALAAVGASLAADIAAIGRLAPTARGLLTFGADNLALGFGLPVGRAVPVVWCALAVAIIVFWNWRWFDGWTVEPTDRGAWWAFILGAVLLTGCFFTGTNYGYRWVFAVWLAPFLWRLPRTVTAPARVRRLAGATAGLLIFGLWADGLLSAVLGGISSKAGEGIAEVFFAFEQPVTWIFFLCLLAFLTHFARLGIYALVRAEVEPATTVP